jgi:hypothetical protein
MNHSASEDAVLLKCQGLFIIMRASATTRVKICTWLSDLACPRLTQEQFVVIELTEGSAINFIAMQILDYKEQGKCQAGLEDNAPFAITITAAMICRLVLPVNIERDESVKGSTALGAADVRYAPMGVISFIPFIQLVGMFLCFMKNICFAVDTHFVALLFCSAHVLLSSLQNLSCKSCSGLLLNSSN